MLNTESQISEKQIDLFLGKYKKGNYIYTSVFRRYFGISQQEAVKLLKTLVTEGLIQEVIEIYCPHCKKTSGKIFEDKKELPDEDVCPHCGETISNPQESNIILYKKM